MSPVSMAQDVSTDYIHCNFLSSWLTFFFLFLAFHHDGPFDACNPHRNRKGSRRAPMQAFPVDSANNALGGTDPLKKSDHSQFMGTKAEEAFEDFSRSGNGRPIHEGSRKPEDRGHA